MVPDRTYLVEEDCLSKFFDELGNDSGILLLIEDPGSLPFLQQRQGSLLDVFQGPSIDYWFVLVIW